MTFFEDTMPTYTYECSKCNTTKDIKHSISEVGNVRLCEICKSEVKQVITSSGFKYATNGECRRLHDWQD